MSVLILCYLWLNGLSPKATYIGILISLFYNTRKTIIHTFKILKYLFFVLSEIVNLELSLHFIALANLRASREGVPSWESLSLKIFIVHT